MPQSLAKVAIHVVYSTKSRQPWLQSVPLRDDLYAYMATILRDKIDSPAIVIGGMPDHIQILCLLSRKFPIMALNWMNVMLGIRAAPLGLNILAGSLPRALPWADIGLARWAETHGADMRIALRAATYEPHRCAGKSRLWEVRNGRCSTTCGLRGLFTAERDGYKWRNIL